MKKLSIVCLSIGLLVMIACGGEKKEGATASNTTASTDKKSDATAAEVGNKKGKLVYKQYCVICHGADGKLAVSGASDLSISALTLDERVSQIKNGKGLMTPYKDILSQSQIQSVAEYLEELKK
jgi:cytochrome c6